MSVYASRFNSALHIKRKSSKAIVLRCRALVDPQKTSVVVLGHADKNNGSTEYEFLRKAGFSDITYENGSKTVLRYIRKHHSVATLHTPDAFRFKASMLDTNKTIVHLLDSTAWIRTAHTRVARALKGLDKRNQYMFLNTRTYEYTSNGENLMIWLFFRCVGTRNVLAVNLTMNCHRTKHIDPTAKNQFIGSFTAKRIGSEIADFLNGLCNAGINLTVDKRIRG